VGTEGQEAFCFSVEISNANKLLTLYDVIINSRPDLKGLMGEWGLYLDDKGFMFATGITVRQLFNLGDNIGRQAEKAVLISPCTFFAFHAY
jgi:hypothetical protein